jgi:hypothetical protein
MLKTRRFLMAVALIGGAASCDDPHDHAEDCHEFPTVSMTVTPGAIMSGDSVDLTVTVENFELRDPEEAHDDDEEKPLVERADGDYEGPCGGHYHIYLDNTDEGNDPLLMDWNEETTLTVDADPGSHLLIVRLNGDDHKFLDPEVRGEATFDIQAP